MKKPFKPEGYNSVSPYLMVKGVQKLMDMLHATFGAEEKRKFMREDGSIMHAEIQVGDSIIMLSDATEAYPSYSLWLHVYVPDAQKTYEKALASGFIGVEAPVNKEGDPDLRGTFKDFAGNHWAIGTQQ